MKIELESVGFAKNKFLGAHYFVAHIAKNLAHQDGNHVTWCGIHLKKVFKSDLCVDIFEKKTSRIQILDLRSGTKFSKASCVDF